MASILASNESLIKGQDPSPANAQFNSKDLSPQTGQQRRNSASQIRVQAALNEKNFGVLAHPTNGDEELYPNRIGNFTKTMRHDAVGEVNPADYNLLLHALRTGNFHDFEA